MKKKKKLSEQVEKIKRERRHKLFLWFYFIPLAVLIVTYSFVLERISVANYKFVAVYTALPLIMLPGLLLFAFLLAVYKNRRKFFKIKSPKDFGGVIPTGLFALFFIFFLNFGISRRLIGVFDTPIQKTGMCRLYRSSSRHGSTEYIELDEVRYQSPSYLWNKIRPDKWDCSYSSLGCDCDSPVRLIILPKMNMVLEVIEL